MTDSLKRLFLRERTGHFVRVGLHWLAMKAQRTSRVAS